MDSRRRMRMRDAVSSRKISEDGDGDGKCRSSGDRGQKRKAFRLQLPSTDAPLTAMSLNSARGMPMVTPREPASSKCSEDKVAAPVVKKKRTRSRLANAAACGGMSGRGAGRLASLDENGTVAMASLRDADPIESSRSYACNVMGCMTARGEMESMRDYCPPERKTKNVLFTPR